MPSPEFKILQSRFDFDNSGNINMSITCANHSGEKLPWVRRDKKEEDKSSKALIVDNSFSKDLWPKQNMWEIRPEIIGSKNPEDGLGILEKRRKLFIRKHEKALENKLFNPNIYAELNGVDRTARILRGLNTGICNILKRREPALINGKTFKK